jgi:hypothetical protein
MCLGDPVAVIAPPDLRPINLQAALTDNVRA